MREMNTGAIASILLLLCWLVASIATTPAIAQTHKTDSLERQLREASSAAQRREILLQLSIAHQGTDLKQAMQYALQAERLTPTNARDMSALRLYLQLGGLHMQLGNYPKALEVNQLAVQKSDNSPGMARIATTAYGNIGSIYYYQGDRKTAMRYYQKSVANMRDETDTLNAEFGSRRSSVLNNIGILYAETQAFDSADWFYRHAYQYALKAHDSITQANILNNMATVLRERQQPDSALHYYLHALDIRLALRNEMGIVRSYHNLGSFYHQYLFDDTKALAYLDSALQKGTEIGAWQSVSSAAQMLFQIRKKQGRYAEALAALEHHQYLKDSLFGETSTNKIAQLELQFELAREQNAMEMQRSQRERFFWMAAVAMMLLLAIVSWLYYLQKSKYRKAQLQHAHLELEKTTLKSDLLVKDKELAANVMYLIHKNELINDISEKLLHLKGQVNDEQLQGGLQKIVLDLQSNLQPELWQEFEYRFQQVHQRFYQTLNERFPELSPSERRLCAFLKLNMSTKEISAITHQNAKSIDVARTRLRKKLQLTGTNQNLVSFLEQLGSANPE